jgi:hypothetical protein
MSEDELERSVLRHVRWDRRSFIKKAIIGGIFVAPAVASFDMFAMSPSAGGATCTTANGGTATGGTSGSGTQGGAGGTRKGSGGNTGTSGGTPDGGCGGAGGAPSDRAIKTAITPISWV